MLKIDKLLVCVFVAASVQAQMPHEVLLLVNRQSQDSLKVANAFAAARKVPSCNVVYLDIHNNVYGGKATISPEQFTKLIWEPANEIAMERGIDSQILAWIYSVDFPIRVVTDSNPRKQMSVGGLTFMRNRIPGLSLVEDGEFLSRLFGGPNERIKLNLPGLSLGIHRSGLGDVQVPPEAAYLQDGLGESMPLPSMMLGYTGENGTDVETVLATINRGLRSDHRGRRGGIYFVQSDNVRSTCREWQYYPAINALEKRGVTATLTTNFPTGAENVMGLLMGGEMVDPSAIKSFAPGAMAEHLTSWSAEFQQPQTKLTEWLKAGATGTAGAVVEPYSNPNKFPSARFFVHYVSGCTMLESFYQSIACPVQNLLLGDPFAVPYAPPVSVKVIGPDKMKDNFTYVAQANTPVRGVEFLYSFLLDGKEIRGLSPDMSVYLRLSRLSDGYHELRAVARIKSIIQYSGFVDKGFIVERKGRSVEILSAPERRGRSEYGVKVRIGGTEVPKKVRLVCGELVLDEKDYAPDVELVFNEKIVGEGPNRIRVIAVYADRMEVSSPPVKFEMKFDS